jgi:hypothetical protein
MAWQRSLEESLGQVLHCLRQMIIGISRNIHVLRQTIHNRASKAFRQSLRMLPASTEGFHQLVEIGRHFSGAALPDAIRTVCGFLGVALSVLTRADY